MHYSLQTFNNMKLKKALPKMENDLMEKTNRTNKVLKALFILSFTLILSNLVHGVISPKTFVSIVGEGVILIEFGILIWGLIIGSLLGLITYEDLPYKNRFRFWFMILICLQNIFYIYVNITEYFRIQNL